MDMLQDYESSDSSEGTNDVLCNDKPVTEKTKASIDQKNSKLEKVDFFSLASDEIQSQESSEADSKLKNIDFFSLASDDTESQDRPDTVGALHIDGHQQHLMSASRKEYLEIPDNHSIESECHVAGASGGTVPEDVIHNNDLHNDYIVADNLHLRHKNKLTQKRRINSWDKSNKKPYYQHTQKSSDITDNIKPYVSSRKQTSVSKEQSKDLPTKPKGCNIFKTPTLIAANIDKEHCQLPRSKYMTFSKAHSAAISHARWNIPRFSHLLLTTSFDKCIKVWDFVDFNTCVSTIESHTNAVKDAKWSKCGKQILSGGFDNSVRLHDIQTGTCLQCFPTSSSITCVQFHPSESNLFLAGTYGSAIYCYDTISGKVVNEYRGNLGEVLDLEFISNGSEFVSASSIVGRASADRTLMVWDFKAAAVISNQLYHEKYTCPYLKVHPSENVFLAQSNANYIAIFSIKRPYKLNKFKRFESHKIEGYPIGFDFSPGGSIVASGSSDGCAYFYNYKTSKLIKKLICYEDNDVCTDVEYHPVLPGVVATCSWKGSLTVWQ